MIKGTGGVNTVYFEGVWEQTTTGARKLYYTFNGQVVAMRDSAAGNAVTYLHGDHLGSISVATWTDANNTVQSSTQEFDPWGQVRSGGVGATSLNYTGQRLDATGLLYYHARYYNPLLARFISGDTIAPGKDNPQARNRYSYVLNNPVRYTDPTGHCAKGDGDNPADCAIAVVSFGLLGMTVSRQQDWKLKELNLVLEGIRRLQKVAGWSDSQFANAVTGGGTYAVFLQRADKLSANEEVYAVTYTDHALHITTIIFANSAFSDDTLAQIAAVHESAHAWDNASGGVLSNNMAAETGGCNGCSSYWDCYQNGDNHYVPGGSPASDYARSDHKEDWAEAVAATVFTDNPRYASWGGPRMDKARSDYVNGMYQKYR